MGQVIFVVCRESIEALLVIGILWAWVNRDANTRSGKKWLIAGILAGLGLAVMLALTLVGVTEFLGSKGQTWFEIGMLTFAAALIVQMVVWMRHHARTLKTELEQGLTESARTKNWWGVFFLAMIAVGREGSETVMFLYGSFIGLHGFAAYLNFFIAAGIGLALAMLFFYLLQVGGKFIAWRIFFRVTEIMLLFLGSSLFLTAVEKLMNGPLGAVNLPNWLYATLWNTNNILSDSSTFGGLLASLFAYRSQPIGIDALALVIYWSIVALVLWKSKQNVKKAASATAPAP